MSRPKQEEYFPKKLGVQYDPPTIVLEYFIADQDKCRFHRMKIGNIKEATPKLLRALKEKHNFYFQNNKLTDQNISRMIDKIKKKKGLAYDDEQLPQPLPIKKEFSFKDSIEPAQYKNHMTRVEKVQEDKRQPTIQEQEYADDFEESLESKSRSRSAKEEESYSSQKSKSVSSKKSENIGGFDFLDDDEPKPKKQSFKKKTSAPPPALYDPTPIPKTNKKVPDFDFEFL